MDSPPHENDQLRLNPGVPQRKPRSVCKLCLWITFAVAVLIGSSITYLVVSKVWRGMRHPHLKLYHDKPEAKVTDWSQVVRPMITRDSTFDIVASVWIRDERGEDAAIRIDGEDHGERLIISETVFRDVSLKSRSALANLTFQVPTSHFKRANISNYDLRASFAISQSNGPAWLDHAKNFTSWRPLGIKAPSIRLWNQEPTFADQIFDSFGFTMPLIQFHNTSSRRPEPPTTVDSDVDMTLDDDIDPEFDDEMPNQPKIDKPLNSFVLEFNGNRTPVTEHHPHIVTRTQLYMIDEGKLYNRLLYNNAQKQLASRTCGFRNGTSEWHRCQRTWPQSGPFETKVQLRIAPDHHEGKGKWRTEWMYAPFLSALHRAPGPKDLLPVPVDRETMIEEGEEHRSSSDEEYITVTWRLGFSGRTFGKMVFAGGADATHPSAFNLTAPEHELQFQQDTHDSNLGLLGHRIHEDAHPRRSFIILAIFTVTIIGCYPLQIHYWYTRTSTVGISRLGTTFTILAAAVEQTRGLLDDILGSEEGGFWGNMGSVAGHLFEALPTFLMLKAVLRLEFDWSEKEGEKGRGKKGKRWIPKVYIARATHLERASERVDGRLSLRMKFAFLAITFVTCQLLSLGSAHFVSPRIQVPHTPTALESLSPYAPQIIDCVTNLIGSLHIVGLALQLSMNFQSQTYAGSYKIFAALWMVVQLLILVDASPRMLGRSARAGGLYVTEVILAVAAGVGFVQAWMYRSVKVVEDDVSDD